MPFVPHTQPEIDTMLASIGASSVDDLFDEIPADLQVDGLHHVPSMASEMDVMAKLAQLSKLDETGPCFLGAGCYDHHIPAAVWDLTARGEFMTAYTPYQAEASQGTLQLIYEYQSMLAHLTGMDVSNASVYDGASGLAEAILMAVRANRKVKVRRVLVPETVHPLYRRAATNIVVNQGIEVKVLPMNAQGCLDQGTLADYADQATALVIQQPNFFGTFEDAEALAGWAKSHNMLTIAVVNPLSLALLSPPGEWGADIVCGDGQPFGIPMASGGPSFGFMCTRSALVRQLPGRIIGRTTDLSGNMGYALTLQAREQHIRRAKATSNICTNQGLLVTAGTIYLSLLGEQGLHRVAAQCHHNTLELVDRLCELPGVRRAFDGAYFHESVVRLPQSADRVVDQLLERGIVAGLALGDYFPDMQDALLVCATEKRTAEDIQQFVGALAEVLA